MGGIADYSGATVLQLPLARRTRVMIQPQQETRLEIMTHRQSGWQRFGIAVDELNGALHQPAALRRYFAARADERWAAYVVGVLQFCLRVAADSGTTVPGLRVLIVSDVPEGLGVASSAALEAATMMAGLSVPGVFASSAESIAVQCQWVENHIVGAPCGIMDQMTSVCGRAGMLLRLRCQPATIEGFLPVPEGYRFFGITSGARHEVTGADYETVRTAAFMGYRIITREAGLGGEPDGSGGARVNDFRWHGYLVNITPHELSQYEDLLPERLAGDRFLERYGGITDPVTRVRRDRTYPVRAATAHPVREQARVLHFGALLQQRVGETEAAELGRLMDASHRSYSACGLGSEATDRIVALAAEAGPAAGVYGARITGGGSGGTVAVLATVEAEQRLRAIAARYAEQTGRRAELLTESGPGADELGVTRIDAAAAHALARRFGGDW